MLGAAGVRSTVDEDEFFNNLAAAAGYHIEKDHFHYTILGTSQHCPEEGFWSKFWSPPASFNDINTALERGPEILAVVGPKGSGKTTIISSILRTRGKRFGHVHISDETKEFFHRIDFKDRDYDSFTREIVGNKIESAIREALVRYLFADEKENRLAECVRAVLMAYAPDPTTGRPNPPRHLPALSNDASLVERLKLLKDQGDHKSIGYPEYLDLCKETPNVTRLLTEAAENLTIHHLTWFLQAKMSWKRFVIVFDNIDHYENATQRIIWTIAQELAYHSGFRISPVVCIRRENVELHNGGHPSGIGNCTVLPVTEIEVGRLQVSQQPAIRLDARKTWKLSRTSASVTISSVRSMSSEACPVTTPSS